jgi:hypothetical protein
MRFRWLTREQKNQLKADRIRKWNKKFAWLPKRMHTDNNEIRWFEFVLRKGTPCSKENIFGQNIVVGRNWMYADSTLDILRIPAEQLEDEWV